MRMVSRDFSTATETAWRRRAGLGGGWSVASAGADRPGHPDGGGGRQRGKAQNRAALQQGRRGKAWLRPSRAISVGAAG